MPDSSAYRQEINLTDYTYDLPEDRIAKFPLEKRDEAKLLVYRKGTITHHPFGQLSEFIPAATLLVFNNTRVIPARLHFQKPALQGQAGAVIEVFLLETHRTQPRAGRGHAGNRYLRLAMPGWQQETLEKRRSIGSTVSAE